MAVINIQVDLDTKQAATKISELQSVISAVAKSISNVPINKDLTAQVKAMTAYYAQLAKTMQATTAQTNQQALAEEKLATAKEKTRKATADANLAEQKAAAAQAKTAQQAELHAEKMSNLLEKTAQQAQKAGDAQAKANEQAIRSANTLQKQYANLLSMIDRIAHKYPAGTFAGIRGEISGQYEALKNGIGIVGEGTVLTPEQLDLINKGTTAYTAFSAQVAQTAAETEKLTTAVIEGGDSIGSLAGKFVLWQVAATLVMQPIQKLRELIRNLNETLVETEDMVIEIKRVLNEEVSNGGVSESLYRLGEQYGQTIDNVRQISLNFARTGMTWNDTLKASEAALLALNVAELDATQASDGLIAVMTQFGYQASDLTSVIDMLNKTADNFPVTTEKLLTALQRTGSAAVNARMELSDTIGVITALSKATGRSGQNLGTAVNSLIQYSTKGESLELFAGLNEQTAKAVQDYKAGMGSILDIWREVGKVIKTANGEQKALLNQLTENAEVQALSKDLHDELGDVFDETQQIYSVANTFRKNYFIALLNNIETADAAAETAADSLGYSAKENEKYMETYTARVNELNTAWKNMLNQSQGFLAFKKVLVDIGLTFTKIATATGGVLPLFLTLSTVFMTLTGLGDKLLTGFTKIGHTMVVAGQNAKGLFTAYRAASEATQEAAAMQGVYDAAVKQNIATKEMATLVTEANTKAEKANAAARAATVSWIMIGVTAFMLIAGAIKQYNAELEREREQTIQNWKSNKDKAEQLKELSKRYDELTSKVSDNTNKNAELRTVEEDIIALLGDKAKALKSAEKGTNDYTDSIKKMTEADLAAYEAEQIAAQKANEKQIRGLNGYKPFGKDNGAWGRIMGREWEVGNDENTLVEQYYAKYKAQVNDIAEAVKRRNELIRQGKDEEADALKDNIALWQADVDAVKEIFENYKKLHPEIAGTTESEEELEEQIYDTNGAIKDQSAYTKELIKDLDDVSGKVDIAAKAFKEFGEDGQISYSTLSKIREEFADAVPNIDEYISKLADSGTTASEVSEILSDLTYKQIEATLGTKELANADANLIAKMLEEKGVTNAVEVADYMVTKAKAGLAAQNIAAGQSVEDVIKELYGEELQSGMTEDAIKDLITSMGIFNNTNLDVAQKTAALQSLAYAAYAAANAVAAAVGEKLAKKDVKKNEKIRQLTGGGINAPVISYGGVNTGGGGGGGGGKSEKDEKLQALKDAITLEEKRYSLMEKEGKTTDELAAQAEKIKSAYGDLQSYLESTNASEADILDTHIKQYDWTEKIQKRREDDQKAKQQEFEDRISLFNTELSLMEKQKAPLADRLAKHKEIRKQLHLEAEYLRSIGKSDKEIKDIQAKWLDDLEKSNNEMLKEIRAERSLRESELTLLEKQNAPLEEQVAKRKEIQADLHKEAEFLREIGGEQSDINTLSAKWLDIQKEILELYQKAIEAAQQLKIDALQKEIDALENAKKTEEERLSLEEKRLAVLEAEKKLQDAMNAATIRIYNKERNQWEWKANQKTIEDARNGISSAERAYKNAITDAKINALKTQQDRLKQQGSNIVKGTGSRSSVINAMQQNSAMYAGASESEKKALHNANLILGESLGATYDGSTGAYYLNGKRLYDNGGILGGMGGIKGTGSPEIVLNPDLTRRILQPTSNAQYEKFVSALGMVFGTPSGSFARPIYSNGSTSNTTYNSVNGIPITQAMADNNTISELFALFNL